METYYLIDFENVHNEGLENIDLLSENGHVHIFSTEKALNIRMDIVFSKGIDIQGHIVPARKQSLDMHLVSYLGHLLAIHGKQCAYVIVSKDTDYDNIIKFWQKEGYANISRKQVIYENAPQKKKAAAQQNQTAAQTSNSKISAGMAYEFSGSDRSELNQFMQHGLTDMGYSGKDADMICKCVVAHCNDEQILSGIHNDLMNAFNNYSEVYEDVKNVLDKFVSSKSKTAKRVSQIRSFFGQHFSEKVYVDKKEEIIKIILDAQTKQQVNDGLTKLHLDGKVLNHIHKTVRPLIKDLPGR